MPGLVDVTANYVDHILTGLGTGMKSLLMDSDTMSMVSVSCPQSRLMSKGVYLFERLDNRSPSRTQLHFVTCVVIASPSLRNLENLKEELSQPRFGAYHLYFTSELTRQQIKEIAHCDTEEAIKTLNDMPLSFCALDSHVFTLKSSRSEEIEGLWSLLQSQQMMPIICHMKSSKNARSLADNMFDKLAKNKSDLKTSKKAILLLFDRRLDPVTPLLFQWTYQAMIHEIFGIKNNVVDLTAWNVPKEFKKIVFASQNDDFFKLNMYKNFGEIGEIIRKYVNEFQEKKSSYQNIENISDIKDFISSYPEFKKMSGTVNKHVNLVEEIFKFVGSHETFTVSAFEQNLCNNQLKSSSDDAEFRNLLANPKVSHSDKKKLLCLYFIQKGHNMSQMHFYIDLVARETKTDKGMIEKLLRNLSSYSQQRRPEQTLQTSSAAVTKKLFKGLRGIDNVYTQHKPVVQDILEDLLKKRTSNEISYPDDFSFCKNIIVYFCDGFTYEEVKAVRDINIQYASNVMIGGSRVWRADDFISFVSSNA